MQDRLLTQPIFVLSTVRSGSTLLRAVLDSHSQVFAPPELKIWGITAEISSGGAKLGLSWAEMTRNDLRHVLWDRLLHVLLERSGKDFIAEKSPQSVFCWQDIAACWKDARFVFLLRHPARIARSWYLAEKASPYRSRLWSFRIAVADAARYMSSLQEARENLSGHTLTYEALTSAPEQTTRDLCDYLALPWEPTMLEYGQVDHGPYVPGLGDWGAKIASGRIQPPSEERLPVHKRLRPFCEAWGYPS